MPRDGSESHSRYFLRRKRLHRRERADGGMPRPRREKAAGVQGKDCGRTGGEEP